MLSVTPKPRQTNEMQIHWLPVKLNGGQFPGLLYAVFIKTRELIREIKLNIRSRSASSAGGLQHCATKSFR